MKSVPRIFAVLSLSALAWACNQEAPQPEEGKGTQPVTSASGLRTRPNPMASGSAAPRPQREPRAKGVAGRFLTAALALDLKDDQRATVKKLSEEAAAEKPEDARAGMKEMNTEIVAGIKAGKVDAAKLEPHYAKMDEAQKEKHAVQVKALNDLHAALTPDQRKALVAALETKEAERNGPAAGAPGASGAAAAPVPPPAEPKVDPAKEKERKADMAKRELERMTRELGLDEAQQKEMEKVIAKKKEAKEDRKAMREAEKKRFEKLLSEFEKDKFDASKLELSPKSTMREHAKMMVEHYNAVLKVIKPEQRDKFASSIERGHGMMGRGMGRPMGGMGGGMGPYGRGGGGRGGPGGPHGPGGPGGPHGPPGDEGSGE
jgi:Spy/CpxP family protein refolding chaperone